MTSSRLAAAAANSVIGESDTVMTPTYAQSWHCQQILSGGSRHPGSGIWLLQAHRSPKPLLPNSPAQKLECIVRHVGLQACHDRCLLRISQAKARSRVVYSFIETRSGRVRSSSFSCMLLATDAATSFALCSLLAVMPFSIILYLPVGFLNWYTGSSEIFFHTVSSTVFFWSSCTTLNASDALFVILSSLICKAYAQANLVDLPNSVA